jgi:hypothetical protein
MGNKSTVNALPKLLEQALNQRIIEGKYTALELTDWLSEQGHELTFNTISKHSREIRRIVSDSDTIRLNLNLSPATLAKHIKDLENHTVAYIRNFADTEQMWAIENRLEQTELTYQEYIENNSKGDMQ